MAATVAPLPVGYYGFLPFDIHLPCVGRCERQVYDTDFMIPRHALRYETSSTVCRKSQLQIELSPLSQDWMMISFGYLKLSSPRRMKWAIKDVVIKDVDDAREQGLYNLPFDRIDEIVVNLCAPMHDNPGQMFVLFDKVINLVELLWKASTIRELSIVLEKVDSQDWHHDWVVRANGERHSFPVPWADDCDAMVVPFCSLRNLEKISVHAHSKQLKKSINWSVINWAMGVARDQSWERYTRPPNPTTRAGPRRFSTMTYYTSYTHQPDRSTSGTDIDRKVAEYYLRIHVNLMRHDLLDTGRHQRRDLLKRSFVYGSATGESPPSSFERDMLYIARTYPDLMRKYDRSVEVFLHLQRIVVCAYDRTRPHGLTTPNPDWDEAAWRLVEDIFEDPLPVLESRMYMMCAEDLGSFVGYNECLRRVIEGEEENEGLAEVVKVGQFLQDWVCEHVYGQVEDEDEDEEEDGNWDFCEIW